MDIVKEVLLPNVNIEGIVASILVKVLDPALQKVVDSSTNPFDNMLKAAVLPELEAAIKEEVAKAVAKLKA
jgi:hypothetical protein